MTKNNKGRFNLQKLKYERLSRGFTAQDVGYMLGVKPHAYYKRERGVTNITVNEFDIIMQGLGIPRERYSDFFN